MSGFDLYGSLSPAQRAEAMALMLSKPGMQYDDALWQMRLRDRQAPAAEPPVRSAAGDGGKVRYAAEDAAFGDGLPDDPAAMLIEAVRGVLLVFCDTTDERTRDLIETIAQLLDDFEVTSGMNEPPVAVTGRHGGW